MDNKHNINFSIASITDISEIKYVMTKYEFRIYFQVNLSDNTIKVYEETQKYNWVTGKRCELPPSSDGFWLIESNGDWIPYYTLSHDEPICYVQLKDHDHNIIPREYDFYDSPLSSKYLCELFMDDSLIDNIKNLHHNIKEKMNDLNKVYKPSKDLLYSVIKSNVFNGVIDHNLYDLINELYGVK